VYLFRAMVIQGDYFLSEGKEGRPLTRVTIVLLWVFHVISWGVPLILCIALLAGHLYTRNSDPGSWCHPKVPWSYILWEAPMVGAFVVNALLYCALIFLLRLRRSKSQNDYITRQVMWRLTLFLVVYFIAWAPDVLFHVERLIFPDCSLLWLGILQNMFAPLQGFGNCLVYGLLNRKIRKQHKWYILVLMVIFSPLLVIPSFIIFTLRKLGICRKPGDESDPFEILPKSKSEDDFSGIRYYAINNGADSFGEVDQVNFSNFPNTPVPSL